MRTPLEALNNCRKSFYGKATTEQNGTVVYIRTIQKLRLMTNKLIPYISQAAIVEPQFATY